MALLHSTWLYITLSWLYFTLQQQLAVSVAERQRKSPKFSGESKYDDFDHWLQNIFRFYVPLDRYDERGKLLELRTALKEGSSAQRAFDFLELLALGSYTVTTQRLKEQFKCMLTPEAYFTLHYSTMALLHSTLLYITLLHFTYSTIPTMALLHSPWLYITLPWSTSLYLTLH